ncbi:MAG TPA: hypothetical protein ENN33_08825 [Ignavibacteria bacterium]|nr:hypothetical protein [Ignavibacteria bacterium]
MKNKDIILKYLSEMLSDEEKSQFELRLKSDISLKEDYHKIIAKLNLLNEQNQIEDDSNYFSTIIPRVREKVESKSESKIFKIAPGIAFGIVVLLIFLLQLSENQQNNFSEFDMVSADFSALILEMDFEDLNEFFDNGYIYDYAYYSDKHSGAIFDLMIIEEANNEFGYDPIDSDFINSEISLELKDITDEEIGIIYEELLNKKIL